MMLGEPTVLWPSNPEKFYIYVLFHEFFYGPYDSLEAVDQAKARLTAMDEYWNYDCEATVRGDITPPKERRIERLTYVSH